ncbi:hypothetical protein N7462_002715 [Penicillium macrosclerotiorum]|uniref:uncharacterized protein n=1 Tax=Penicillium macrosclerotiorum TaxID=303699 RepID=UPI0025473D09|nr:uncharacterized protein N7462_002715 [Penicillium macrosclerotiorum]KAJ5693292.1 hypothetical protein N7462_002715 [Penicillium macrosclerotiorum]
MGDYATTNDPAANAPDAAFAEKGKGKAQDPTHDLSMDEDESDSESEAEMADNNDDDEDGDNLEPISEDNIISGGRRTRGKNINWEDVRIQNQDEMEDDEDDDEDYQAAEDDNQMRD